MDNDEYVWSIARQNLENEFEIIFAISNKLILYNKRNISQVKVIQTPHEGPIKCLEQSTSGRYWITSADDKQIVFFEDTKNGKRFHVKDVWQAPKKIASVKFCEDDALIFGDKFGDVFFFSDHKEACNHFKQKTTAIVQHLKEYPQDINCSKQNPWNERVMDSNADKKGDVKVKDEKKGKDENSRNRTGEENCFGSDNGRNDDEDNKVKCENSNDWIKAPEFGHNAMLTDMCVTSPVCINTTHRRALLLTTDRDSKLRVSVIPELYETVSFCLGHTDGITSIVFLFDELCVTAAIDKTLRLWNILTGEEVDSCSTTSVISSLSFDKATQMILGKCNREPALIAVRVTSNKFQEPSYIPIPFEAFCCLRIDRCNALLDENFKLSNVDDKTICSHNSNEAGEKIKDNNLTNIIWMDFQYNIILNGQSVRPTDLNELSLDALAKFDFPRNVFNVDLAKRKKLRKES